MSSKKTSFYNAAKSNQNGAKLKFAMFTTALPVFNQFNFSYTKPSLKLQNQKKSQCSAEYAKHLR